MTYFKLNHKQFYTLVDIRYFCRADIKIAWCFIIIGVQAFIPILEWLSVFMIKFWSGCINNSFIFCVCVCACMCTGVRAYVRVWEWSTQDDFIHTGMADLIKQSWLDMFSGDIEVTPSNTPRTFHLRHTALHRK